MFVLPNGEKAADGNKFAAKSLLKQRQKKDQLKGTFAGNEAVVKSWPIRKEPEDVRKGFILV